MAIMQDNEKLDLILERFYNRYNKYNTNVLKKLGDAIKQFDGVSINEAYKIAQELELGIDIYELQSELAKINTQSIKDVNKLFNKVADENLDFAIAYSALNDDPQIQNIIQENKKQTDKMFIDMNNPNNIGFTTKNDDGKYIYRPLTKVYNDLINEAVYNVSIGNQDYQSAMRNTIKQLANSGIKVHQEKIGYKSGYNRRIDSSVRQAVLTGLRQVNLDMQKEIGKKIGANGVEISAHPLCAIDHLDIQGRQFSDEEFEKLDSELTRPIGEYNCRHFVFSIILGVNLPSYTKSQLARYKKESLKQIKYNGETYTKYEATQVQRQLETAIRKQKDLQIMARASGDKEEVGLAQQKITELIAEYNRFSKIAGLDTYKNRLTVSGYHRLKSYDKK